MYNTSKLILIISLSAYLISCGNDSQNLNEDNLRGNVKSVLTIGYKAEDEFGIISEKEMRTSEFIHYNQSGKRVKRTDEYFGEKQTQIQNLYTYDSKGNLIEWKSKSLFGDTLKYISKYTYDDKNYKIIEEHNDKESGFSYRYEYKYDATGKLIQKVIIQESTLTGKTIFTYIGDNVNEEISYDGNGKLLSKTIYSYENEGKIIRSSKFNANGERGVSSLKILDDVGNLIEYNKYDPYNNFYSNFRDSYDAYGNIITESNNYGKSSSSRSHEYEYDKQGNWIKDKIKSNDIYVIEKRTIEYYQKNDSKELNISSLDADEALSNLPIKFPLSKEDDEKYFRKSFKQVLGENNVNGDLTGNNSFESIDEQNYYVNNYFNCSLKLPDTYNIDRGNGEHTVVRATDSETATSIAFNVIILKNEEPSTKIESEFQTSPKKYVERLNPNGYTKYISDLMESVGNKVFDINTSEKRIGDFNYLLTTYKTIPDFNQSSITYITYSSQTYINGAIFSIAYSAPEFNGDYNMFCDVVNSFKHKRE